MLAEWAASVAVDRDAPCLHFYGRTLSRGEVDQLSDALAVGLQRRGVKPGDRVALVLQNIPQFVIAVLAVWRTGAIVVPTNPMLKDRELHTLLADSGAVAVLAGYAGMPTVTAAVEGTDVSLVLATDEVELAGEPVPGALDAPAGSPTVEDMLRVVEVHLGDKPVEHRSTDDDLAFLTYTSGTTGVPKGAMNTFGNVRHSATVFRDWVGLDEADTILAVAPLFHITGTVAHIALSLLTGAPLVLTYRFSAPTVVELIERYRPTFTIGSITVFIALRNEPAATPDRLASLRKVYSGGAPIPATVVADFQDRYGTYIHNAYGLTETTSPSHLVPFGATAPADPDSGTLAVGVPVAGTSAVVVDDQGNICGPGETGEIVVAGPQVVPGYWQRPDETAQALPGGRLRTGDVGFVDGDGWFYVVDRKKDMINASGFKVWPREVEDVLYAHPAVREAAVVGAPDPYRGETVVAYVSLRPGADAHAEQLIAHCRERLATYKAPRRVDIVDELP